MVSQSLKDVSQLIILYLCERFISRVKLVIQVCLILRVYRDKLESMINKEREDRIKYHDDNLNPLRA